MGIFRPPYPPNRTGHPPDHYSQTKQSRHWNNGALTFPYKLRPLRSNSTVDRSAKVLLINTNVVLAFDSQEICRTPGETENIDKYNTGAMKIHLTVRRRFNLIDFKIDFISLFYINRTSAFVSILNCLTT